MNKTLILVRFMSYCFVTNPDTADCEDMGKVDSDTIEDKEIGEPADFGIV